MRRTLVAVHIVSAVGLIGADLALLALGVRGAAGAPPAEVYPAMSLIAGSLMLPLGLVALSTGLVLVRVTGVRLSTGWVAAKLAITTALAVALVLLIVPGLAAAAEAATGAGAAQPERSLAYAIAPAASATLLTSNVLLATFKPRRLSGILRSRRRSEPRLPSLEDAQQRGAAR